MFERFTDRARRVVVLAQEEARMLNHNSIGTEHILLGLIREGEGLAGLALESLGLGLETVREQAGEIDGEGKRSQGEQAPSGHMPFTRRAKRVLELSLREALQLGDDHIDTEHILLGLLREGDGAAAQVLVSLGTDLNRVRAHVVQLMAGPPAGRIGILDVESRLTAVEQWIGIAPGLVDLDQQILQARSDRRAAAMAHDHERAASLRAREKELRIVKASLHRQLAAEQKDLPSLAEQVRQLSEEVERLRGLLRRHGIEPDEGSA